MLNRRESRTAFRISHYVDYIPSYGMLKMEETTQVMRKTYMWMTTWTQFGISMRLTNSLCFEGLGWK